MPADHAALAAALDGATVGEAQRRLSALLAEAGILSPALDARKLLAAACGIDATDVIVTPERRLTAAAALTLTAYVLRRMAREPVSRILGRRHFHGLEIEITEATLDPRPETESLVDGVLELIRCGELPRGTSTPRILDVGTGSGAILLALLAALPGATGVGIDSSAAALSVASRNAARLGFAVRATFQQSNWLSHVCGEYDVIVTNPPYIPSAVIPTLDPEVAGYDPLLALDGGPDGLAPYRQLLPSVSQYLTPLGWLVMEIGHGQSAVIQDLAGTHLAGETRVWLDLAGKPRCVAVRHQ